MRIKTEEELTKDEDLNYIECMFFKENQYCGSSMWGRDVIDVLKEGKYIYSWMITEEPLPKIELNLTEDDVGKRVRHKDGGVRLITAYNPGTRYPITAGSGSYTTEGYMTEGYMMVTDTEPSLIELLD
jgi:hypothetical protein